LLEAVAVKVVKPMQMATHLLVRVVVLVDSKF
jgi:hypothetical protein